MLKARLELLNNEEGDLNKVDGIDCGECKNRGYINTIIEDEELGYEEIVLYECECMPKRKVMREIQRSGLERQFKINTFNNFKVEHQWQKVVKDMSVKYLNDDSNKWLVLSGASGAGKTHLATAVSLELIKQGNSFKYFSYAREMPRLQGRLRSGFMDVREQAEQDLEKLLNVDVLYIDDFLKVGNNLDNVFELIDGRYFRDKKTIITTELSNSDLLNLDEALGGRIIEKSNGYFLYLTPDEKNYRLKG